jgi:hypothetical protein
VKLAYKERERAGGTSTVLDDEDRFNRIRCPLCKWRPRRTDRWGCTCGHAWNTFDTHGVCPSCSIAWRETQCLRCHEWSPHERWYAGEE